MSIDRYAEIRQDCLVACADQSDVHATLSCQSIAVTGGTGFLGTWIAEMVAALNDDLHLGITLELYARNTNDWAQKYPHLSTRDDIHLKSQDVRSPFEFSSSTNLIVHAAGIPDNRVHSSDPLRVYQTTVLGINNALDAASQLGQLRRFLNVSSCMVSGAPTRQGALSETDYFPIPSGQLHTVYAEAKRVAENLSAIYRSQFRMPVSIIRPFTFAGPYQELDRPWAINNFLRDLFSGGDIRIHGDGSARRSYLYGSDAAWWTLTALAKGRDGEIYNIGSPDPISHIDLVSLIGDRAARKPHVVLNTLPSRQAGQDDLFPDTVSTRQRLAVTQTCSIAQTVDKTWRWYSSAQE
jgi:dTDP-glucose 4,6-dehydratase